MKKLDGLQRGMGIGGWLTNYKRFNVLPPNRRMQITIGDMEHFESYITEADVAYIASLGAGRKPSASAPPAPGSPICWAAWRT